MEIFAKFPSQMVWLKWLRFYQKRPYELIQYRHPHQYTPFYSAYILKLTIVLRECNGKGNFRGRGVCKWKSEKKARVSQGSLIWWLIVWIHAVDWLIFKGLVCEWLKCRRNLGADSPISITFKGMACLKPSFFSFSLHSLYCENIHNKNAYKRLQERINKSSSGLKIFSE